MRTVIPVTLAAKPPHLGACFKLLKASGAEYFALFGGAIRDADYAARHHVSRPVKDYDLRIWMPAEGHDQHIRRFVESLSSLSGEPVQETPSAGTNRIRYCLNYQGIELDISIRPISEKFTAKNLKHEDVAHDRAQDSDIGICSVAIDATGQAWATPEYLADQTNRTLTVYPSTNQERITAYTKRMQEKFPSHTIIKMQEAPAETSTSAFKNLNLTP